MSVALEININDLATPEIQRRLAQLSLPRLADRAATAVAILVRTHLRGLGPNKRGWPSTGFWRHAANSVSHQPVPEGQVVSIAWQGVRQRLLGGHIAPVNAKALTIPISPEAYGHTAADFPGSFLMKTKKGAYIVQYTSGKGKNATFNFLFKLVAGVDQEPDPDVLPTAGEISTTALGGMLKGLNERN